MTRAANQIFHGSLPRHHMNLLCAVKYLVSKIDRQSHVLSSVRAFVQQASEKISVSIFFCNPFLHLIFVRGRKQLFNAFQNWIWSWFRNQYFNFSQCELTVRRSMQERFFFICRKDILQFIHNLPQFVRLKTELSIFIIQFTLIKAGGRTVKSSTRTKTINVDDISSC